MAADGNEDGAARLNLAGAVLYFIGLGLFIVVSVLFIVFLSTSAA